MLERKTVVGTMFIDGPRVILVTGLTADENDNIRVTWLDSVTQFSKIYTAYFKTNEIIAKYFCFKLVRNLEGYFSLSAHKKLTEEETVHAAARVEILVSEEDLLSVPTARN